MIQNVSTKFRAPPIKRPFADEPIGLPTAAETLQARKPDPENEVRIVDRLPPWDLAVVGISPVYMGWIERQIRTPRPIRRFILWAFRWLATWYAQARMLVTVIRSPEVTDRAYRKRQEMCGACEENVDGYCRACGCPKWVYAQLERKNRRAGWLCPRRKHAGEYPRYDRYPGCGKSHAGPAPQRVEV